MTRSKFGNTTTCCACGSFSFSTKVTAAVSLSFSQKGFKSTMVALTFSGETDKRASGYCFYFDGWPRKGTLESGQAHLPTVSFPVSGSSKFTPQVPFPHQTQTRVGVSWYMIPYCLSGLSVMNFHTPLILETDARYHFLTFHVLFFATKKDQFGCVESSRLVMVFQTDMASGHWSFIRIFRSMHELGCSYKYRIR